MEEGTEQTELQASSQRRVPQQLTTPLTGEDGWEGGVCWCCGVVLHTQREDSHS